MRKTVRLILAGIGLLTILLLPSKGRPSCKNYDVQGIEHGDRPDENVITVILDGVSHKLLVKGDLSNKDVQKMIDKWMATLIKENCR